MIGAQIAEGIKSHFCGPLAVGPENQSSSQNTPPPGSALGCFSIRPGDLVEREPWPCHYLCAEFSGAGMALAPLGEPLPTDAGSEVGKVGVGIEAPPESALHPKGRKLLVQASRPQASTTAPCCVPVDISLHLS